MIFVICFDCEFFMFYVELGGFSLKFWMSNEVVQVKIDFFEGNEKCFFEEFQ